MAPLLPVPSCTGSPNQDCSYQVRWCRCITFACYRLTISFDFDAYRVLDCIVEVIESQPYRIVNLSLGPDLCVEDASEPNRWTATLDRLAYEHDVLFVSAVGNNGHEDHATGLDRVQVPADMANGLSVGSSTSRSETGWKRSGYSAIGPGRAGSRVQPTGVQFGGNEPPDEPFLALSADCSLYTTRGTSYATPIVVHSLAGLSTILGDHRKTSATLRTFAAHFAERHPNVDAINEVGFGRFPSEYRQLLACAPNEVHLLYQDRLERTEVMAVALPFPRSALSGPHLPSFHARIQLAHRTISAARVHPGDHSTRFQTSRR